MGSKFIPVGAEGSRILDSGPMQWDWLIPWACRGCKRYGKVGVVVAEVGRTTDDELKDKIERTHHHRSPFCIAGIKQRVIGRVYRIAANGNTVYLRAKGEEHESVRHQVWPPRDL